MFAWQLTQLRPSTCFSLREYGLVGWRLSTWHCWQSRGLATFRRFSWFEPCGSWQVAQLSTTGACSQRKGPRFSAWQVKHVSLAEFSLRSAGVTVPCGLWQAVQVILPSRSGMCEERIVCARFWRWHWPQGSITVARARWAGDEGGSAPPRRRAPWGAPCKTRRADFGWQPRPVALRRSTGVVSSLAKLTIPP